MNRGENELEESKVNYLCYQKHKVRRCFKLRCLRLSIIVVKYVFIQKCNFCVCLHSSPLKGHGCFLKRWQNFDVLLTVHLSIFILVINQTDVKNFFFYNKFILCLYMFQAPCAHRQEVKIVFYSLWYHNTCRWSSGAQVERGLDSHL